MELLLVFLQMLGFFAMVIVTCFVFAGLVALTCCIYDHLFGGFGEEDD